MKNKTKASDLTGIRLTVVTRRDLAYLATTVPTALSIEIEWFKFPLFNLTTAKDALQYYRVSCYKVDGCQDVRHFESHMLVNAQARCFI